MNNIFKKPYEISLWEDKLVYVTELKGELEKLEPGCGKVIAQYYKEIKVCTIGSSTLETPIRAFSPKLNKKINGEIELTFSIYSHYADEETGELLDNPFKKLLVNERKVKLREGTVDNPKWYDFVIKNVNENSDSKVFTYTAKSLFINELSKTGFNIEFDKDLENNIGNISTLGKRVLQGSDWQLEKNAPILRQKKEEPLYKILLSCPIQGINVLDSNKVINLEPGTNIYVFYSVLENKEPYFQFLYSKEYQIDDNQVIINKDSNYYIEVSYDNDKVYYKNSILFSGRKPSVSNDYRGNKLVRKQITKYDPTIDKYISVYSLNGDPKTEVYGFVEHNYVTSNFLQNFVTNSDNFSNLAGWGIGELTPKGGNTSITPILPKLDLAMVPDVRDTQNYTGGYDSFLTLEKTKENQVLVNSGLVDFRTQIGKFSKGKKYLFRAKYGVAGEKINNRAKTLIGTNIPLKIVVAPYTLLNGHYILDEARVLFSGVIVPKNKNSLNYQQIELKCNYSLSYKEMLLKENQLGIFLNFEGAKEKIYLEEIQFFEKYVTIELGKEVIHYPGETLKGTVQTKYYYYYPNKDYKDIESVKYLYEGYTPSTDFSPKYNTDSFEKVRMITASESNRFNLLQDLCEIFQCWVDFKIDHYPNGRILLGKDNTALYPDGNCPEEEKYRQQKWVNFYEETEKESKTGFIYGINLKAIQRSVESEGIVSKIVVKENSNPSAKDGFCTIARADESESGESFIYDFSYYEHQGLIDPRTVANDLYTESEQQGYLGYYPKLKRINKEAQRIIEESSLLKIELAKLESANTTYITQRDKTQEELSNAYIKIEKTTGITFEELEKGQSERAKGWLKNESVYSQFCNIIVLRKNAKLQVDLAEASRKELEEAEEKLKNWEITLKESVKQKEQMHEAFYKKYSRFIQEGSWISEDYNDDDLYYLDAKSTLHTSAQPKVKYTIDILELSSLPGYENYSFEVGEKSYIQDTEFFGWIDKFGVRTPYKEEVIVTEILTDLDAPENNKVVIQNYKTQFEDLFQRITATTQSVEFKTGTYNKASEVIQQNGEIKFSTLQNSLSHNSLILQNAKNQSVLWNESGITATSLTSPNEMVRVVSGGIFVSEDGGLTWKTGITGKGISANVLTAGLIDTTKINVGSGAFPSFRWDDKGLNAYQFEVEKSTGKPKNFNYANFVRMDQYGFYGVKGNSDFDPMLPDPDGKIGEDKIQSQAKFSLTWRGFQLKSDHPEGGYISISSDKDLEVKNKNGITLVKIGMLNQNNGNPIYGLQLKDNQGNIVINQDNQGRVWIKDQLSMGSGQYNVSIGSLLGTKKSDEGIHEVINANNKFKVYEDGSIEATDGKFTGEINATSGQIGNLSISKVEGSINSIDQIAQQTRRVEINSDRGFTFNKVSGAIPKDLTLSLETIGFNVEKPSDITWYGSANLKDWTIILAENPENNKCVISYNFFEKVNIDFTYYVKVEVKYLNMVYNKIVTLTLLDMESAAQANAITCIIRSTNGDKFVNSKVSTKLICQLFNGIEEIDPYIEGQNTDSYLYSYSWSKFLKDGSQDISWGNKQGKTIVITSKDIQTKATFSCEVSQQKKGG